MHNYVIRPVWFDEEGEAISYPLEHAALMTEHLGAPNCYGVYRVNEDGTHTHVLDFDDTIPAPRNVLPPIEELFPFEYQGGGYFRKRNVKKGEAADILHGREAIQYLYDAIKQNYQ